MRVMHRRRPTDRVAAAGHRDHEPLPDLNQTRVRNIARGGDLLVCHKAAENFPSNGVQVVAGLHEVDRAADRGAGAAGAGARQGDADGGVGRDGGDGEGGRGEIGSWLVRLLLDRGYIVHATVQNLQDESETKHLEALEGAAGRLRLFQIDLLDTASIVSALHGVAGVFHLASPCIVDRVHDPEGQLLDPAVKGTLNVLRAAHDGGVRRVVVTSSISAIIPSPGWPEDAVKDESCWTDLDYCRQHGIWYPASKTMAEKAAWDFAKENGLNLVVVNPGTVMGPIIPPNINASMLMLLRLLQGCTEHYKDFYMGSVHVKDVALAHILLYENPSAFGRHLCIEGIAHFSDFASMVAELFPEYNVPKFPKDTQPGLLRAPNPSKKLINLGMQFISMDQIIKDSVDSLRSKGYIS